MAAGLAKNLATIPQLRTFSYVPEQLNPPAAVTAVVTVEYDDDFDDNYTVEFGVLVIVTRADARSAQIRLYDYLEAAGERSVRAAIDADPTLDGSCATCQVVTGGSEQIVTVGGQDYLAVEFVVRAMS